MRNLLLAFTLISCSGEPISEMPESLSVSGPCHDTAVFVDHFIVSQIIHCLPGQHVEVTSSTAGASGTWSKGAVGFVIACKCPQQGDSP